MISVRTLSSTASAVSPLQTPLSTPPPTMEIQLPITSSIPSPSSACPAPVHNLRSVTKPRLPTKCIPRSHRKYALLALAFKVTKPNSTRCHSPRRSLRPLTPMKDKKRTKRTKNTKCTTRINKSAWLNLLASASLALFSFHSFLTPKPLMNHELCLAVNTESQGSVGMMKALDGKVWEEYKEIVAEVQPLDCSEGNELEREQNVSLFRTARERREKVREMAERKAKAEKRAVEEIVKVVNVIVVGE